jgi:hypothetical protein
MRRYVRPHNSDRVGCADSNTRLYEFGVDREAGEPAESRICRIGRCGFDLDGRKQVTALLFINTGTEVQRVVEPHRGKWRNMGPTIRSNCGDP